VNSKQATLVRASRLLRFVPSGLGAHAAARKVLARSQPLPKALLRQRLSGGVSVELDLSDRAQAQAYLLRRYEPEIIALLTRLVPRRGVLFDVGANLGLITFAVGVRRPDIFIFAFEPDPANARRWRRNLELNAGVNAVLEQVALGAEAGDAELVRGDESGWSFIAPPGRADGLRVPVINLDGYCSAHDIPRIDVLKADVEGYEANVLQGAASLLDRKAIGFILCEMDDDLLRRNGSTRGTIVSFLAEYGYSPRPVPGVGFQRIRKRSWETSHDLLFVR
jgi:FkbM family methyltransferase